MMCRALVALAILCLFGVRLQSSALAQPDASGIDFVTIGAVGNAPWQGDGTPQDMAIGRGRVDYEYRIGRFEVTTAQWVEFFNAAYDRPANDRLPHLFPPTFWGAASAQPHTPGGLRWTVPAGNEMRPVGNISWRMAAMYANWLCNHKSTDRAAFMNGAYDVSAFGTAGEFLPHNPNAQYWIPSWDEWLKAAHYDPNRFGMGQGGWWTYSNGSDVPCVPGPPGVGTANFGFRDGTQFTVSLGAYPQTQSPWGLFDVAGATAEWTDEVRRGGGTGITRAYDGSFWNASPAYAQADGIWYFSGDEFSNVSTFDFGLRIASAVPAPGVCVVGVGLLLLRARRHRKGD